MSLKTYDELTPEQKEKVKVMYSDQNTVKMYLYNFDDKGYHGRQYAPPTGKDEEVGIYGTIVAESTVVPAQGEVQDEIDKKLEKMREQKKAKLTPRKSKK
jgi:hypothetical protein